MMKLSEVKPPHDAIERDAEFVTAGYVDGASERTLVFCDTARYLQIALHNPNVSCIVTTSELAAQVPAHVGLIIAAQPRTSFYRIHNKMLREGRYPPVPFEAAVGVGCAIHPTALIAANVRIGAGTRIDERVIIKENSDIGEGCHIHAGAVIGCDGILYFDSGDGIEAVHHAGGVRLGRRVQILANAVIVRSIHDTPFTEVHDRSIVGIATTVGHEARIGRNCVVSGNCVVARRAIISDGAWIGTSSMIREHLIVGSGARVMAGSIVVKDVAAGQSVSGNLAVDHRLTLADFARRWLPRPDSGV